jgi:molybdopterin synthase sulfur carrier subunit
MVTVVLPGMLRADADGQSKLSVSGGDTLADVLAEIGTRWPRLARRISDEQGELRRYVNIYIDGEDCRDASGLATPVPDGAEIQVLPSVAGG